MPYPIPIQASDVIDFFSEALLELIYSQPGSKAYAGPAMQTQGLTCSHNDARLHIHSRLGGKALMAMARHTVVTFKAWVTRASARQRHKLVSQRLFDGRHGCPSLIVEEQQHKTQRSVTSTY